MLSIFKKLFFTFTFHSSLFILLIIGIQNNSIKKKVNILVGETVKLPIAFIVGISFISGSFCGDILRLNLDNGKE